MTGSNTGAASEARPRVEESVSAGLVGREPTPRRRARLLGESGQAAVEYALVLVLLVAMSATVAALGDSVEAFLTAVGTAIEALIP